MAKIRTIYQIKNRDITLSGSGTVTVSAEVWHLGELVHRYASGGGITPGVTDEEINQRIIAAAERAVTREAARQAQMTALATTVKMLMTQKDFEVRVYEPEPELEPVKEELEPEPELVKEELEPEQVAEEAEPERESEPKDEPETEPKTETAR